jgi:GH15 family glucan-1,4-alpha-glucosidase
MIDWVCDNWDQPDEGIWATRGGARTSPTDGSRSGSRWTGPPGWPRGRPANVQRWTTERDRVYNQIIERGWNPTTRAFTQHYTTEVLNSSLRPRRAPWECPARDGKVTAYARCRMAAKVLL